MTLLNLLMTPANIFFPLMETATPESNLVEYCHKNHHSTQNLLSCRVIWSRSPTSPQNNSARPKQVGVTFVVVRFTTWAKQIGVTPIRRRKTGHQDFSSPQQMVAGKFVAKTSRGDTNGSSDGVRRVITDRSICPAAHTGDRD